MKQETQQEELNEYDKQAQEFLRKTGTKFKAVYFDYGPYFQDDKESRAIFKINLKNANGSYTFKFGQSIAEGNKTPSPYSVLACLTKYDPGTFEDFCNEFGYDEDSRKAEKIYKAVIKEWQNISRLFTEEQIELMQEIQ